jgi:hypothetical protein
MPTMGFMKIALVPLVAVAVSTSVNAADTLEDSIAKYRKLIVLENSSGVPDVYQILKVPPELKGLKRVRAVLPGLVYRGGADNKNTSGPEPNKNPLTGVARNNLCAASFSSGYYLYPTNYSPSMQHLTCNAGASSNNFEYLHERVLSKAAKPTETILKAVHSAITGTDHRPLYLHCWNGWHASGYISALVLRQFCDVSAQKAADYWAKTADQPEHYAEIVERVKTFKPIDGLKITDAQRAAVCPSL